MMSPCASEPVMALREAALASARRSLNSRRATPTRRIIWTALAASFVLGIAGAGAWAWLTPRCSRATWPS